MAKNIKLGIIGTAGRKDDGEILSKEIFDKMIECAENVCFYLKIKTLVSGGAAYADHVAVKIFLKNPDKYNLLLHLPAHFIDGKFEGNESARIINYYHSLFSKRIGINSLSELDEVIKKGAAITISNDFWERNSKIAMDSDALLAMTFGLNNKLKKGGTNDTMKKYLSKNKNFFAYHYDLTTDKLFNNASVEPFTKEENTFYLRTLTLLKSLK